MTRLTRPSAWLLFAFLAACGARGPVADTRVQALLETIPLVDGHNDLLIHYLAKDGQSFAPPESYGTTRRTPGQVDLPRLRAGRVGAAVFTVRWADLKRLHGTDTAAISKAMKTWDAEHPAPTVGVSDVADHVEHVRRVAGIDHVGLGSDFDGMGSLSIKGLADASTFPALLQELAHRGWTDTDLGKLAGGNFLRVLQRVEAAATPRPSTQ